MSNITTCLWFDNQAKQAADFYVELFTKGGRRAKIGKIARYGQAAAKVSGQPKGSILTVEFELDGNKFMALNGGAAFKFSPAASFVITCEKQKEIDYFWNKLTAGGKAGQCGWIDYDKFGLTWQIVPKTLAELMSHKNPNTAENAMKALIKMKKIDIAKLVKAAANKMK